MKRFNSYLKRILITLLLLFFAIKNNAETTTPIIIDEESELNYFPLASFCLLLKDVTHELTFQDVNNGLIEQNGERLKEDVPNLDFTSSAYWVKFQIIYSGTKNNSYNLEVARPLTNVANLYIQNKSGDFTTTQHGDELPFNNRELYHRKILFPLSFHPGDTLDFYLQLASDGEVITLPINLWTEKGIKEKDYSEQLMFGLYFGILLFVFIINFFFYIALKEKSFLYYILYVFSLFFMQLSLDGLAYQYLWASSVWMGNHAILIFSCLTIIFVLKYARAFMKLNNILPKIDKVYTVFITLTIFCLLLSLSQGILYSLVFPASNGLGLLSIFLVVGTIFWARKKNHKISILFTLAFLFVIAGALLFILGNFNIVQPNTFTEHGLKFGSALEVIFLSISMANRYREIQKEKEEAQLESIERLEEMNKLKDEINIELEKQVKERTAEVVHQKEELLEKNKEITDSINYAKGIQSAILPTDELLEKYLTEHFVFFQPKDIVSGDFYWMQPLSAAGKKETGTIIAVADCTGHGVPGAFVSMAGANALNRCVKEYGLTEPAKILDKLTELVEETFKKRKDGMDISLLKIDFPTSTSESKQVQLEWSGANNPIWYIQTGQLKEIKADKQPIGAFDYKKPFTNHKLSLGEGDSIYIFSDGFPDQFGGEKGKKFKYSNFKELILSIHQEPMTKQKEIISQTITGWMGTEYDQIDDICIVGIRL